KCKLHRTLDRDVRDAFALVDPGVGIQVLGRGLADGLQFFLARFGAFLFVSIAMRRSCYQHQHENSEKEKEQNDAEPRPERNRRAFWCSRYSGHGHVNSSNAMPRSTADRALEKWMSFQLTADKVRQDCNRSR